MVAVLSPCRTVRVLSALNAAAPSTHLGSPALPLPTTCAPTVPTTFCQPVVRSRHKAISLAGRSIVVTRRPGRLTVCACAPAASVPKCCVFLLTILAGGRSGACSGCRPASRRIFAGLRRSPNAVNFAPSMRCCWLPCGRPRVATVGKGAKLALAARGFDGVIAPQSGFDSESVPRLAGFSSLRPQAGRRILILRGDGGRDLLGETLLTARGARVEYLTCYRRSGSFRRSGAARRARPRRSPRRPDPHQQRRRCPSAGLAGRDGADRESWFHAASAHRRRRDRRRVRPRDRDRAGRSRSRRWPSSPTSPSATTTLIRVKLAPMSSDIPAISRPSKPCVRPPSLRHGFLAPPFGHHRRPQCWRGLGWQWVETRQPPRRSPGRTGPSPLDGDSVARESRTSPSRLRRASRTCKARSVPSKPASPSPRASRWRSKRCTRNSPAAGTTGCWPKSNRRW